MPFLPFSSSQLAIVTPIQPRVQYSAVTSVETRLPEGIRPASLLGNRTGSLFVGDLVSGHRSEAERTVEGSLLYIRHVAAALPIDRDDESIVDAMVAKRMSNFATRPLRRRDGDPR